MLTWRSMLLGLSPEQSTTIVVTSTIRTAVISQKRESKHQSGNDEMAGTTLETLCTKGFVVQRKNVKIFFT